MNRIFKTALICSIVPFALAGCANNQPAPSHATTQPVTYREADEIKSALTYLASDQLEGRGLETQGIYKAADYIETQFKKDRLAPLSSLGGYRETFPITITTKISPATELQANDAPLVLAKDYSPLGTGAEGKFSGKLAFVGYSIDAPEKNYDDFSQVDLKGKVALAFRFEPADAQNKSRFAAEGYSEHAPFAIKAKAAAARGAIALLLVNPSYANDRLMTLATSSGGEKSPIPLLQISRDTAASLLQQAGQTETLDALQSKINTSLQPHSLDLAKVEISGNVSIDRQEKQFSNIIACLPGNGKHKDEFVVVGAHYDHLGRGEPGSLAHNSHQIHNGADDNGSGTTAVLELAEELSRHGPLDRSVLFITFVGEERGLLGSMYLVAHPPVPLDKIVAMVNLDMVGRVRDNVVFVGGNGTAKDFDDVVAAADKDSQLVLKNAGADVGGRGGIGPSDHMAFAMKHIPVLFFWSGMHADYHRPSDKVDKINFLGIAQVVDFTQEIIEKLAAMPREEYIDKYDHNMMGGVAGMKVRLGIMPDYNTDENVTGVRIAGTIPDAPAAKAGLLEGDLIVQIDAEKIDSLGDYMTVLSRHKPGDVVKITIERNKTKMELPVTLSEPKG